MMPTYKKVASMQHSSLVNFKSWAWKTHADSQWVKPSECICFGNPISMSDHLKVHMGTHIGEKQH